MFGNKYHYIRTLHIHLAYYTEVNKALNRDFQTFLFRGTRLDAESGTQALLNT